MKSLPLVTTLLLTLTTTPTTQAWSFTWRNASNTPFMERSMSAAPCTQIDQAEGKEFVFEPNDSPYSFYIWSNDNCSGSYSGFTPPSRWGKKASTDLRSFMVNYGGNDGPATTAVSSSSSTTSSTTTSSSTSTGTATGGSATTTTAATASASATSSPGNSSGSSSGISGGAVAGIVIGVVAGIAVVGGAFWLGRRRRGGSGGSPGQGFGSASGPGAGYVQPGTPIGGSDAMPYGGGYMGAEVKAPLQSMYENHPMSPLPVYQPPVGQQYAELPGESARVEMSDTSRVNELDGSAKR
ncbi:hypothetical protein ANOM_009897 [Aspergillus nomiae NRRL 13137]|uniref:Uncharacterized protein n=1 Tax=Aspergillus nomiae NRRL (strain ATCC 15546 / NRRL 13137 / CBS 260.88 / M93) TaxID=1509407 RepID=A0A0L1IPI1_ASPN3|nr:uncharacterized protein ANOM_009897 [Aspergillus nomiae NRRL 13137]KNG81399.1 hypothetical protein ANOM_009897 [Aspergillus nomiae NRRL 13137]